MGVTTPPPGATSSAMYQAADELEAEMVHRTAQAAALDAEADDGRALHKELEALACKIEEVRLEADELYAKELQAHDGEA